MSLTHEEISGLTYDELKENQNQNIIPTSISTTVSNNRSSPLHLLAATCQKVGSTSTGQSLSESLVAKSLALDHFLKVQEVSGDILKAKYVNGNSSSKCFMTDTDFYAMRPISRLVYDLSINPCLHFFSVC